MEASELMLIPYSQFVAGLFLKPADQAGRAAHAAVGILGELLELRDAVERAEALEELGDLHFYVEASWQQLMPNDGSKDGMIQHFPQSQAAAQHIAETCAGALLDCAKKGWIYASPLDSSRYADMCSALQTITYCLKVIADHLGFTYEQIESFNRQKLIKRYPGATYTDAAAQARADKA